MSRKEAIDLDRKALVQVYFDNVRHLDWKLDAELFLEWLDNKGYGLVPLTESQLTRSHD